MKRKLQFSAIFLIFILFFSIQACKQGEDVITPIDPPVTIDTTKIFSNTYGTVLSDLITGAQQCNDGGIIVCGYTISGAFGDNDIFIMKLNGSGNVVWSNLYGGSGNDQAVSMIKTSDGYFVICGTTTSFSGTYDPYAMKIDQNGNIIWNNLYRWWNEDYGTNIIQTDDGGFLLTGYSNSFSFGGYDVIALKLDQSGIRMWYRVYGGAENDYGTSVTTSPDGGYMLGGYTFSYGVQGDAYIIKTYGDGVLRWSKSYGGAGFDNIKDMYRVSNGFLACGSTSSFGLVDEDAFMFNIDNQDGFVYWTRTFDGNAGGPSTFNKVISSPDGGSLLVGNMQNTVKNLQDLVYVKLYGDGEFNSGKIFGGAANDGASSIAFKQDGGLLISGSTGSFGAGSNDMYLLSLYNNGTGCNEDNPFTPLAGSPVPDVFEQPTANISIDFYDTMQPSWNITGFSVLPNTQCIRNPK